MSELFIYCLVWNPDGQTLASDSSDRTVRLWDIKTGECLHVLISDRSYEGMNISGVKGLTVAQASTFEALGGYET